MRSAPGSSRASRYATSGATPGSVCCRTSSRFSCRLAWAWRPISVSFCVRNVLKGPTRVDAVVIYVLIEAIVLSMLMQAAFAILGGAPSGWRPVSGLLAHALAVSGIPVGADEFFFYWAHITAILCFLIYIPGSKHRHMFLAAPNVYLRPSGSKRPRPRASGVAETRRPDRPQFRSEANSRPLGLYGMRPMPGGLPGICVRPAAQPQDADHGSSRCASVGPAP